MILLLGRIDIISIAQTYFMTSLSLIMRLISLIMRGLTHTGTLNQSIVVSSKYRVEHTLFTDQGIVSIVGVVGVSGDGASILNDSEIEFCRVES